MANFNIGVIILWRINRGSRLGHAALDLRLDAPMPNIPELIVRYEHWLPVFIFFARIVDVSLGTIRTIMVIRGVRVAAFFLGFVEVSLWVMAVSSVVRRLDQPLNVLAYAGGFATGNWVGMWLEGKLALGHQVVRMISRERGHSIAGALRLAGISIVQVRGETGDGPVTICFAAARRREVTRLVQLAQNVDGEVLVTIEDVRATNLNLYKQMALQKTGWRAAMQKK
jgi:uncharacterized protein YebE (UPF0316 family)